MPRQDISFQTVDNVTLRGWLYTPANASGRLPCIVMAHGMSALKDMDMNLFAEYFTTNLPVACLGYDHRGFGDSDTKEGQPRFEIIPAQQNSDFSDAITYAQSLPDIDPDRIGIWGTSLSGGHALWVGAVDRRVKLVLCQVPMVDGWTTLCQMVRPDFVAALNKTFQDDRLARASGNPAGTMPMVDADPLKPSALPTPESYEFFSSWGKKCDWKNEITIKSMEAIREYSPAAHIHHISPTPLLMTVAKNDFVTPTNLALEAYSRALEPKRLQLIPGGHFDGYSGPSFEKNAKTQADYIQEYLLN